MIIPDFARKSKSSPPPYSWASCTLARRAGLEPVIVRTPGLAFDLDTPLDWQTVVAGIAQNSSDNPTILHE